MRHALATLTPFVCAQTVLLVLSVSYLLRALAVVADPTRPRFEGVAEAGLRGRRRNEICVPIRLCLPISLSIELRLHCRADCDGCRRCSAAGCVLAADLVKLYLVTAGRSCGRLVLSLLWTRYVAPDSGDDDGAERPEHDQGIVGGGSGGLGGLEVPWGDGGGGLGGDGGGGGGDGGGGLEGGCSGDGGGDGGRGG